MYKACIYCQRKLGNNEAVENFPVGRRIAFDQDKGRLWVVCERCRRWNLSPLDQRWEAIEECERQFRDTTNRFSTDNIGLARLPEGLELVRIGRPQRREFAAWRYGKQFLRRRVRQLFEIGAKIAAVSVAASFGVFVFAPVIAQGQDKIIARVRTGNGDPLRVTLKDAQKAKLIETADAEDGWMLELPYRERERNWGILGRYGKGKAKIAHLDGPTAIRAAGRILPKVNTFGGSNSQVQNAVQLIEEARNPERLFKMSAAAKGQERLSTLFFVDATRIAKMDATTRLALEMASHEEAERRAFEGELEELEEAWREAEEIAAIADTLLLPESVENWIRRQKKKLLASD